MKKVIRKLLKLLLFLGTPLTYFSALWLKFVVKMGINKTSDKILMNLGVLPVLDHYYQPLINPKKHLTKSLRDDRVLNGIDFNDGEQLALLSKFNYNAELLQFPLEKTGNTEYFYNNRTFISGDSEFLYNVTRHFKPSRVIEIGCGSSTLMIQNALKQNKADDVNYLCEHVCIEPYEQPWLKELDVTLMRTKVEEVDKAFFEQLKPNDILFIDSSHMIRPQGDVMFEYLELLPILKPGVIVHVHDIFSPKDYPDQWVFDNHLMYNEQYLLEAFLMFNNSFRVIGALNYLTHHYPQKLADKCPVFGRQEGKEPGSFWMIRN